MAKPDLLEAAMNFVLMVQGFPKDYDLDTKAHGLAVCLNNRPGELLEQAIAEVTAERAAASRDQHVCYFNERDPLYLELQRTAVQLAGWIELEGIPDKVRGWMVNRLASMEYELDQARRAAP